MSFRGQTDVVNAELEGKTRRYQWRKNPSQATSATVWYDLAVSPGHPKAKLWFDATPLTAQQVKQSTDGGLYHGASVLPSKKYLRLVTAMTATATSLPLSMYLCDYLLYYPSIDDSDTDPQVMDNTLTLPRYTDGAGVQMIAVSLASRTGNQSFTVNYTNQDGVANRTSAITTQNSSASIGALQSGGTTNTSVPFIGLQHGDTGVRSVESVTMSGADVGFFAIVLVKPLGMFRLFTTAVPSEKDFLITQANMPEIQDDAFLNILALPQGAMNATILIGDMKIVWD